MLHRALGWLKQKWRDKCSYPFARSQFKSIRQDLMVRPVCLPPVCPHHSVTLYVPRPPQIQHINNDFTVHVYEVHARVALENGDSNEFNQCQTQLIRLYRKGLKGCRVEFIAYRVLYFVYSESVPDAEALLAVLTPEEEASEEVQHALHVQRAAATGNFVRFFKLYRTAPNMGCFVMDFMLHRMRMSALMVMSKSFRQSLLLSHVAAQLAFDDVEECKKLLSDAGAALRPATDKDGATGDGDVVWRTVETRLKYVRPVPVAFEADDDYIE